MKSLVLIAVLVLSHPSIAQYQYFRSRIECTNASKEEVAAGYAHLQEVMNTMKQENKLFGYNSWKNEKEKSTFLAFNILAENESIFKAIVNEWISRSKDKSMDSFWKGCPHRIDSSFNKSPLLFPIIKDPGSPVTVVPVIDEGTDPKIDYKIVYDFTAIPQIDETEKMDSSKVNWGLEEVGRQFNLHAAAGIPKEKIKMTLVIHALGSRSFLSNEKYQKRYKPDNPNLSLIKQLTDAGVKIVQCGQSATWMGLKKEMFIPEVKIAISAKTAISQLQMKGYALLKMTND